jgi:adenylate cyclase
MAFRLTGIGHPTTFDLLGADPFVVGRATTNDCPVVDPTVSRQHAELRVTADGVAVRDLGSSNGTFVNDVPVAPAGGIVRAGETVRFGQVRFTLEALLGATPTTAAAPVEAAPPPGATIVRQVPRRSDLEAMAAAKATPKAADPAAKDRQRLALLLEVSKGLGRATDLDALLAKIVEYAFQVLEADRCAILLTDPDGTPIPKLSRDRRGQEASGEVPQSILRTALEQQVAILSDDAAQDARFTGQSVILQKVRSAMCVPLLDSAGRALGALYVDNFSLTRFGEADLDLLIAFAGIAAVSLENGQLAERIRREALARSNFERFFTPQLAARIASSPDAVTLGGEKRPVAILFSDIRGFTALSETMNPDAMARLLTEYFTEMVECVFRHGGTLDKFIGDAVMAQWGAPLGAPDDCDRAMQAALDMMTALDALNAGWLAAGRPTLEIGIGLNVGDVFAGNIGSERRLEYTVIGDPVNTSSRLCGAAGAGEILLSDHFRAALSTPPALEPLPPMELKGKSQPLPVFRVRR